MWPVSVGIYNKSAEKVKVELYAENTSGVAEIFPLLINRFNDNYEDVSSRNLSPLTLDTLQGTLRTVYQLDPGECLGIAQYWDDEYRGYRYYQSAAGSSRANQAHKIQRIIIQHLQTTITASPEHLDSLVVPLNREKKVWGMVIQ